jgi:hypothetical protein
MSKREPSPMQRSRKKFLRRLIPWGIAMLREAEGLGLDVEKMRLEEISFWISLYKQERNERKEVRV